MTEAPSAAPAHGGAAAKLRSLGALSKPGITAMAAFVAAGGLALAPTPVSLPRAALLVLGVALVVGAANALNMYVERHGDGLMTRTSGRPLPAGLLEPRVVLVAGILAAAVGLALLALAANALTTALAAAALLNYVAAYTPLKRRTPLALLVGAPSGAMPVLLGFTAATGRLEPAGLALFAVLFLWQLPHFVAIAIVRRDDYARAGMQVVSVARGDAAARRQTFGYALALAGASLALPLAGIGGAAYLALAAALNAWFVALCSRGVAGAPGTLWARAVFRASLAYVPGLAAALAVDAVA